jgi:hypothetical protein
LGYFWYFLTFFFKSISCYGEEKEITGWIVNCTVISSLNNCACHSPRLLFLGLCNGAFIWQKGTRQETKGVWSTLLNPVWPGGSTRWLDRSGFNKRPAVATARPNPDELGRDPVFFFFQMWDLKSISIYTLCFQEKSHVFLMWDKKPFGLNTST